MGLLLTPSSLTLNADWIVLDIGIAAVVGIVRTFF